MTAARRTAAWPVVGAAMHAAQVAWHNLRGDGTADDGPPPRPAPAQLVPRAAYQPRAGNSHGSHTTPAGTATSAAAFTVVLAPTITSFSPPSGAVGALVTITGANFTGATRVTFNGKSASYTVVSPMQITARVPSGAKTGPLSVATPGGTTTSASSFAVSQ